MGKSSIARVRDPEQWCGGNDESARKRRGHSGAPEPTWSKNLRDTRATQRYLAGKELDGQPLEACKEAANLANSSWNHPLILSVSLFRVD